jgi:hypothetical protein
MRSDRPVDYRYDFGAEGNVMQPKIVGTAPAQGARAVLCRKIFDQDAVEFAIVDLHCWALEEQGAMIAYVFDAELGEPVPLEWVKSNYGGLSAASAILETKATNLSGADMDALERMVRRRHVKVENILSSDWASSYRAKVKARVKAMYESTQPAA